MKLFYLLNYLLIALTVTVGAVLFYPSLANAALINAIGVIGQVDYSSNMVNSPDGSVSGRGFYHPNSDALDTVNHRLFESDQYNRRVLVFQLNNDNTIASNTAQYVVGSCDLSVAGAGGQTQTTFGGDVINLAYDSKNSRLFVSDAWNNRVLAFDMTPSTMANCKPALFVLGQSTFLTRTSGTSINRIHSPDDVDYDSVNSRLFVSDQGNHRIMAFNVPAGATSTINGESALFELGQVDFNSAVPDTTRSSLYYPSGVAYDSANSRLFVSDMYNSRVMAFNTPAGATSTINGEDAIFELGEPDFTSYVYAYSSPSYIDTPDDMTYDITTNRLFVCDVGSSIKRVDIFITPPNATSSFNYAPAQAMIGQNNWGTYSSTFSQSVLNHPESGHAYDPVHNIYFIHDSSNNRSLEFSMIHISTASLPSGTVGIPYSQTINITAQQGTSQTFSIYSGSLPSGLSLNSSTGVISGAPTAATTSTFTIEADDNFASGPLFDRATYSITTAPSSDATLSSLAVSSGTLNPVFSPATAYYSDSVDSGVTSVAITPTVNQANATITVNGTTVASGSASSAIALHSGENDITTTVTAQDGLTTQNYTIAVTATSGTATGSVGGSNSSSNGGGNGNMLYAEILKTNPAQPITNIQNPATLKQQLILLIIQLIQQLQAQLAAMIAAGQN